MELLPALGRRVPRPLAAATAAFGVAALAAPGVTARQTGLSTVGEAGRLHATLARVIGGRDLASAALIVAARPGRELRGALLARAAMDAGDALAFALVGTRRARATSAFALAVAIVVAAAAAGVEDG
jgi:hypothetical protein